MEERRVDNMEHLLRIESKVDNLTQKLEGVSSIQASQLPDHEYIKIVMAREARKEKFQQAIIEKTTVALLWSFIVGAGSLIWLGFKDVIFHK